MDILDWVDTPDPAPPKIPQVSAHAHPDLLRTCDFLIREIEPLAGADGSRESEALEMLRTWRSLLEHGDRGQRWMNIHGDHLCDLLTAILWPKTERILEGDALTQCVLRVFAGARIGEAA